MRWKWILGIIAAAFVVLLVVVYIIAASYDYNKLKPLITDTTKEFTGRELTLGGDIDLKIGWPPTLEAQELAFQNASWGSQPQMARLKKLQVRVAIFPLLAGNLIVKRLVLIEPEFLLETNKSGKSNLDFEVAQKTESPQAEKKTAAGSQTDFELEQVTVKEAKISYRDHRTGRTETLELANLTLKKPLLGGGTNVDVKGSYNQTPFQVNGNIGLISQALKSNEKWPFNLEARALKTQVSAQGSIRDLMTASGIELKLKVEGEDLAEFEKFTGKPLPVKGSFGLSGHVVSPSENMVQVSDLSVALGESQIQGSVTVKRDAKRPRIEANLTSKKLKLRPMLAEDKASRGGQKQAAGAGARKDKVFSNQPFDLSALQKMDAKVNIHVDQIIGLISAIENYEVEINLQNGHLIIKPFTGNIGDGNFSGTIDLVTQANTARLKTRITAQKINLGEMLKKMDLSDDVEGTLELDIELAGQGNSVAALMAGLNGYFIASMGKGKMPMMYLNLVGADLGSSLLDIVNPTADKTDQAEINCAVCDFNITNGMATGDAIIIDDPHKTLVSSGTLNLKTEELDFDIQSKPKEGVGRQDTVKFSVSFSKISKPFKLSGTLADPSIGISAVRTATLIGRVFVPGGIATLFISASTGNKNPCVEAVKKVKELAATDKATSGGKTTQPKSGAEKKEGLGGKILNLFKKPDN